MSAIGLQFKTVLVCFGLIVAEVLNGACLADPPANTTTQPAQIEAWDEALLYARFGGLVREVNVHIGDHVKAGQVLVKLDLPEAAAELKVKQAQVEQARSELERAKLDLVPFELEIKLAGPERVNAPAAKAHREILNAAVKVAAARLAVAEAEVNRAAVRNDYATLRAPFDGVIARRHVSLGTLLLPATGSEAQPLVVVVSTGPVRVSVQIPEQYVARVEPGADAIVEVDAIDQKLSGKVSRTAGVLRADRTMLAQIDLPNPNGQLLPGMFGRTTIVLRAPSPAPSK